MVTVVTLQTAGFGTTAAPASITLIPIATLLVLLILKEVVSGLTGAAADRFNRSLGAAVVPLLLVFLGTLVAQVVEVFR